MKHGLLLSVALASGAIGFMAGRSAKAHLTVSGGAYDYAGSDNDTDSYSTPPEAAVLSPNGGWVNFRGMTVTALPLTDSRTGLFARLKYEDALQTAKNYGADILTDEDLMAIHEGAKTGESLEIDPFVRLPLKPPVRYPGETDRQYGGRIMAPMGSLHWAKIHDAEVHDRLAAMGFQGDRPVSNIGKYWIPGGFNFGWYQKGATGRDKHQNEIVQSKGGEHIINGKNDQIDYSQLTMLKKRGAADVIKGWFS